MDKGNQIPSIRRQGTDNRKNSLCIQLENYKNLAKLLEDISLNKALINSLNAVSKATLEKVNHILMYLSPNSASLKDLSLYISDLENSKKQYNWNKIINLAKNSGLKTTLKELKTELKTLSPKIPTTKEVHNNKALSSFQIKYEDFKGDFFKPCPCTPNAVHCGYKVLTPAFGCKFNCSYCFLNFYQKDRKTISIYKNTETIIEELENFAKNNPGIHRVGTGEFTDSFAVKELDFINTKLLDSLHRLPNIVLEFKSKSDNINTFIKYQNPPKNAVLSWSINPQRIIDLEEDKTVSLTRRIELIKEASKKYRIGIHFDPIFMEDELLPLYLDTIDKVFTAIPPANFVWVSLGGYRFTEELKLHTLKINNGYKWYFGRYFEKSWDNKFRYPSKRRIKFYKTMAKRIKLHTDAKIYMCMESLDIWEKTRPEIDKHVLVELLDKFVGV